MNISKAIIEIKKRKNRSYDELARCCPKKNGMARQGKDISATLSMSDNLNTNTFLPLLDALGYEMVLQEKRPGVRREDQIVITIKDEETPKEVSHNIKLLSDKEIEQITLTGKIDIDELLKDDN